MNFILNQLSNNIKFNVLPDHCISGSNGKLRIIIKDDSLLPILLDYFIHRVSNGN